MLKRGFVTLIILFFVAALSWAQSVTIDLTAVNTSITIDEAAILSGVASNSRVFDLAVTTTAAYSMSVELTSITGATGIPADAVTLTANATGEVGTTNVTIDPFSGFGTSSDISAAFSGLTDMTDETSQIDVQINLDQLGDRNQNDTLTISLLFIITESL